MIGAIIGDIVGSRYEVKNPKIKAFPFFTNSSCYTDDTVMTIAVGKALMQWNRNGSLQDFKEILIDTMHELGNKHPFCGFGGRFTEWIYNKERTPYNSYGNGSAMRVSPCGFFAKTLGEAEDLAKASAEITHNHPEGIKGAQAVASAVFMAKSGEAKTAIKNYIESKYYRIDFTLNNIRKTYTVDVSCQGSVPQALEAFFESVSFEDAIRNAVSIGGDTDTIASICGGIAEAYYGIDDKIKEKAFSYLDEDLFDIAVEMMLTIQ